MADLVKVPYTELMARAAAIRQEAEATRAELQALRQAIDSIQWMGKRAERFFTAWEQARPEMENWILLLENLAMSLEVQARRMQAADEGF
ncbi:MAG: WXG100 family type VII secretion target [Anaerolineae bacterium]